MVRKDRDTPVDRFPLAWPAGNPRTPDEQRKVGLFRARGARATGIDLNSAVNRVITELDRLGGEDAVLSTNVPIGMVGLRGSTPENGDPGAAIYFHHARKPIVFACDRYTKVADNIAAIGNHIEAVRAIERYGVGRLEQILVGFQRQLTGRRAWWEVFDVEAGLARTDPNWAVIEAARLRLARKHHPDVAGGSGEKMAELNEAFETAKREFGK